MQDMTEHQPVSSSSAPCDWAEAFYARGWQGRLPWVVVEQVWRSSRRVKRVLHETQRGWGFGLVAFRVLDAPMFDIFAPNPVARGIVEAMRAYPARRAAQFEAVERPSYEANGYPAELLEEMAPRPSAPLNDQSFRSPVLLVTSQAGTTRYALLGAATTLDVVLESLVAHGEVKIDQAVALMILLTCHGKPGAVRTETRSNGTVVLHRGDLQTAFTRPFHPERFKQVKAALGVRSAEATLDARRSELNRLLAAHIPRVIASLRQKPLSADKTLHSVARSRLAEVVSETLGLSRGRRTRIPWWTKVDAWPERKRRRFYGSLTAAQRSAVHAVRRRKRLPQRPSTARVHLSRAKVLFAKALHE